MIAALFEVARQTFVALMRRAGLACALVTAAVAGVHALHGLHADEQLDLLLVLGALGVAAVAALVLQRWERAGLLRLAGPSAAGYSLQLAFGLGAGLFASLWLVPVAALVFRDVPNNWPDVLGALPALALFLVAASWLGAAVGRLGLPAWPTVLLSMAIGVAPLLATAWIVTREFAWMVWDEDGTRVLYTAAVAHALAAQAVIVASALRPARAA